MLKDPINCEVVQVVKQRMQTGQFPSAHSAVRQILAKEGVRGLYAVCDLSLSLSSRNSITLVMSHLSACAGSVLRLYTLMVFLNCRVLDLSSFEIYHLMLSSFAFTSSLDWA